MKKINKNDLKVNVTDVTSLNDTGIVPDAERLNVLNQMAVSDAETNPTCVGHTIDENETCVNCGSDALCHTAAAGCQETVQADTCNVTASHAVLCCIIETDKSDCCIEIPSKVNCLDTDICVKTLDNCVETVDQCISEPID